MLIWAAWLVVTYLVFSYMAGTIHQYYTVALAPAVAALAAIGVHTLWTRREQPWARGVAAAVLLVTVAWTCALVFRTSWYVEALAGGVIALAAASLVLMVVGEVLRRQGRALSPASSRACLGLAVAACLLVPVAHSLYTASQGYQGSIVTAGPSVEGADAMGGMGGGPQMTGTNSDAAFGGAGNGSSDDASGSSNGAPGNGSSDDASGSSSGAPGGMSSNNAGDSSNGAPGAAAGAMGSPSGGAPSGTTGTTDGGTGAAPSGSMDGSSANLPNDAMTDDATTGDGMGGGMGGGAVSEEVSTLLLENADSYTWVAAAVGSQSAAGYQLATEYPVMPIGGFNGTDPSPTLEQFKQYVSEGRIHYFIASGQGGVAGSPGAAADESIATWVEENFESTTVDNVTLYDLTQSVG